MTRLRMTPEVLACERHNTGYGGGGVLSHVVYPNGSVASIPQAATDLLAAVVSSLLEAKPSKTTQQEAVA